MYDTKYTAKQPKLSKQFEYLETQTVYVQI